MDSNADMKLVQDRGCVSVCGVLMCNSANSSLLHAPLCHEGHHTYPHYQVIELNHLSNVYLFCMLHAVYGQQTWWSQWGIWYVPPTQELPQAPGWSQPVMLYIKHPYTGLHPVIFQFHIHIVSYQTHFVNEFMFVIIDICIAYYLTTLVYYFFLSS